MKRTYFLSLILMGGVIAGMVIISGCGIMWYLDIASFVIVVLPPLLLSLAVNSPARIARHFTIAFADKAAERLELENAQVFFKGLFKYFLLSGIMGTLFGIILVLSILEKLNTSIGEGISASFLTLFYSIIFIILLVVPFQQAVERRLEDLNHE